MSEQPYYQPDLARIHHLGFGFHADACAPGILDLLAPVRERGGQVLEVGCGSGHLTKHLIDAGHHVLATDASPAMLDVARDCLGGEAELQRLTLPDDPVPPADAIVSVGHALNYLPDEASLYRALDALAAAVLPGGVLAIDLCDLEWGRRRRGASVGARIGEDWAIVTEFPYEGDDRFVREITTFTRNPDGSYRRGHERQRNVLVDTATIPARLATHGLAAEVLPSFGTEELPCGLGGDRRPPLVSPSTTALFPPSAHSMDAPGRPPTEPPADGVPVDSAESTTRAPFPPNAHSIDAARMIWSS